jgi:riboflavin kinase/FMN adenylyltransferase
MASYTLDWEELPPDACRGGVVTIGNFDGVHLGHVALLEVAREQARSLSVPAIAVTFDPHPMALLRPGQAQPPLTTAADRLRLLQEQGADHVLVLRTSPSLLGLRAAEFFRQVIQDRFAARALIEGHNFGFGRGREGNVETLGQLCDQAGLTLTVVPARQIDGYEVSSSRIRALLQSGDVGEAARLLGRPHRVHGVVGTGQRRGQQLGFPTANLEHLETLAPGNGVYAVRVALPDRTWPGAANVGPNPTFGEDARKLEVHLIGFAGDLYGRPLAVDFLQRLRDTRPFPGVAELVAQLRVDVEQAQRIAAGAGA